MPHDRRYIEVGGDIARCISGKGRFQAVDSQCYYLSACWVRLVLAFDMHFNSFVSLRGRGLRQIAAL
jgi:hypothetical protein